MEKAKLLIRTPAGRPFEFLLDAPVTTIGRSAGCDLTLESAYISRRHARIECAGSKHVIVDEKSKNGVFLNGKKITKPQPVGLGDEIRIGDISMVYAPVKPEDESTDLLPDADVAEGTPIRLDPTTWEVWIEERRLEMRLSLQEFALLSFLCGRGGRICERDELGDAVWGAGNWDLNMLHRLVHRLREKVEPDSSHPRYVVNVPGVGYRLQSPGCD
ncbi:MAG: hypothetical protein A2Y74_01790 [Actinobacteria bacterium RBG_13_63_9]|nr:MAG: hypothetical protein A2Y74_01790 [Actinobacteria bacterium RBG_13_63_9]